MGKASSSKKVARAARAGGSSGSGQRKVALFPIAIVAIVVLGVALVAFARADYTSAEATAPVADQDHWHNAYGVSVCDAFNAPLEDANEDTTGIHTHGDGIIHIHPFAASAAGKNATLGKWGEIIDVDFGSDSITLPDGTELKSGYDCGGNTDTTLGVWVWPIADQGAEPKVYTEDFGSIRLDQNEQSITIAVVPNGTTPPRPESEGDVAKLDPATDEVTDTTVGATTDSTVTIDPSAAADPTATTASTVAADPTATTASTAAADPNASTTSVP